MTPYKTLQHNTGPHWTKQQIGYMISLPYTTEQHRTIPYNTGQEI